MLILLIGICVASVPPLSATNHQSSDETTKGINLSSSGNLEDRLVYRVQICALQRPVKDARILRRRTKVPGPFYMNRYDGFHRYSVGRFFNFEDAMRYRAYLIDKGVDKFIFVVAFYHGQQLTGGPEITPSSFSFQ